MNPSPIFTHYKETEGYFGVGKVPNHLQMQTQELHSLFFNSIPEKARTQKTYHQWFAEFPSEIQEIVSKVQADPFWKTLCTSGSHCRVENIPEMDELYYSKAPGTKRKDLFLYGATGNFDPHVDGIFSFPGMHFYRILIGLTPNKTVETRFLKLNVGHRLQENDYILFDFDKAQHQVINSNNSSSSDYRIMLKLHFLVCDSCESDSLYFPFVKQSYILYETVTRYCMQTGTDPSTPYQFFVGLICVLANNYKFQSALLFLSLFVAWPASFAFKRNKRWQSRLMTFNLSWIGIVVFASFGLWLRFLLTGQR